MEEQYIKKDREGMEERQIEKSLEQQFLYILKDSKARFTLALNNPTKSSGCICRLTLSNIAILRV